MTRCQVRIERRESRCYSRALSEKFLEVVFLQDVRGPELLEEPVQGRPLVQQERACGIEGGYGKRREGVQGPQRGGYATQRIRCRKGYRLHKIGDGDPIFRAGVPDARSESGFGRRVHAAEVTCHIARARVDPQQVRRSSHDDAEGPVGAGPLGQIPDVVEFGDTESLVQAASRGCDLLLRNHEVLHWYRRTKAASNGYDVLTRHASPHHAVPGGRASLLETMFRG